MNITRRHMLQALSGFAAYGVVPSFGQAPPQQQFSPATVDQLAKTMAAKPYDANHGLAPESVRKLSAKTYSELKFRPERAFLADTGSQFRVQLNHIGYLYSRGVTVNLVNAGKAWGVPYSPDLFDFSSSQFEALPPETGYGGFRLHYPLNTPGAYDELISFLGASNFRALGRGQRYGLHARGVAVDTALPSGEEFPYFREVWIETPAANASAVLLHALLDSPSLTGAYHFKITPGVATTVDVSAILYARKDIKKLGLAPMASMFFAGEGQNRTVEDYRPEVHNSDGLLMHNGAGEWLWRPLRNPSQLAVSDFVDRDVRGFGLMQRDRNFDHYQDMEAGSQDRPSYWIEPLGDWGEGMVELVEIPTPDETNENILCYWVPKQQMKKGASTTFSYRLHALAELTDETTHPGGRVVATYQKALAAPEGEARPRRFIVDFSGGNLNYYLQNPAVVEVAVTSSSGKILQSSAVPHPRIGGFRASFDIAPQPGATADMRVYLRSASGAISETWIYPWRADA